jgi:hypothetical protein
MRIITNLFSANECAIMDRYELTDDERETLFAFVTFYALSFTNALECVIVDRELARVA